MREVGRGRGFEAGKNLVDGRGVVSSRNSSTMSADPEPLVDVSRPLEVELDGETVVVGVVGKRKTTGDVGVAGVAGRENSSVADEWRIEGVDGLNEFCCNRARVQTIGSNHSSCS